MNKNVHENFIKYSTKFTTINIKYNNKIQSNIKTYLNSAMYTSEFCTN